MKIDIKSVVKPALVLFIICLVTTALLALANMLTTDKIDERANQEVIESRKKVLGAATTFEDVTENCVRGKSSDNQTVGYVITVTEKGYGGDMQVMVGIREGKVNGVSILSHSETAGLGAKAAEADFLDQYKGLSDRAEVDKNIDKITGATISSKAVTRAVNTAMEEYQKIAGEKNNG
jgi:electron transport complex protein RnfG